MPNQLKDTIEDLTKLLKKSTTEDLCEVACALRGLQTVVNSSALKIEAKKLKDKRSNRLERKTVSENTLVRWDRLINRK